ncbi:polyhydroxyalkanoic acid system family protein [Moritella sp. 5]|uniref:polyhydroxyalkanoic acid system family protein n=1 Tax=Moritella sp. 5 TaxID=2746231 RepID=UPI001BA93406|nr:polyhydroxyalkanoic acid system family protein [Moritella sp. 5]QUM81071.1 polyhydroxyalkanoic acid system family protein [Moritella sp. 5]
MGNIEIIRGHSLPHQQIICIADKVMLDIAEEYDLKLKWQGDKLHIKHAHTRGYLHADSERIKIKLKLGILLFPVSFVLKQSIEETLDELLPSAACSDK